MNQTVVIILLAVAALFLLFQLYNVLGKKVGRQPEDDRPAAPQGAPAPTPAEAIAAAHGLDAEAARGVAALKARDPQFDVTRFLDGARQAYETIVRAYAAGDVETLKPLLSERVLALFEAGIQERSASGAQESVEFVHPPRADIDHAEVTGDMAQVRVRFLAELLDKRIESSGETTTERRTAELWTFERRLGVADPNWRLTRTEPATA